MSLILSVFLDLSILDRMCRVFLWSPVNQIKTEGYVLVVAGLYCNTSLSCNTAATTAPLLLSTLIFMLNPGAMSESTAFIREKVCVGSKDGVSRQINASHHERLHVSVLRVKSWRVRWAGHVNEVGDTGNA
jgi:hypothetical protein